MQLIPVRVLEGDIPLWYDAFTLTEGCELSSSFIGISSDWVEIGQNNNGLTLTCKMKGQQQIGVRMEAWMEEPPWNEEEWDEKCDILIDWTWGEFYLAPFEGGMGLRFSFGSPAFTTDYHLRISRQWQGITALIPEEGQSIPHSQEQYLFQVWPVPIPHDEFPSKEERESEPPTLLSSQEKAILGSMARGVSNIDIIHTLQISPRAFHHSVVSLMQKLEANDRTAAIVAALKQGLIALE